MTLSARNRLSKLETGARQTDPDFPVILARFFEVDGPSHIGRVVAPWGTFVPEEGEDQTDFVLRALRECPPPPESANARQFEIYLAGHFRDAAAAIAEDRPIDDETLKAIRAELEELKRNQREEQRQ